MDDAEKLKWYENKYGPIIEKRGLRNWKNLFRKPTPSDWLVLFMLLMALFIAWAYQHDTAMCREYVQQQQEAWNYTNTIQHYANYSHNLPELPNLNLTVLPNG